MTAIFPAGSDSRRHSSSFVPVLILLLTSVAVLSGLLSCSPSGVPDDEKLSALGLTPLSTGVSLPDISITDADGIEYHLSDYEGDVVLLNFWASWCPPCRAEMPSMERLAEELSGGDFTMLAVNVGEPADLVAAFIEEFDIGFPVHFDPDGRAARDIGVSALPTSLLIDADGNGVAAVTGAFEWDEDEFLDVMKAWTR